LENHSKEYLSSVTYDNSIVKTLDD